MNLGILAESNQALRVLPLGTGDRNAGIVVLANSSRVANLAAMWISDMPYLSGAIGHNAKESKAKPFRAQIGWPVNRHFAFDSVNEFAEVKQSAPYLFIELGIALGGVGTDASHHA